MTQASCGYRLTENKKNSVGMKKNTPLPYTQDRGTHSSCAWVKCYPKTWQDSRCPDRLGGNASSSICCCGAWIWHQSEVVSSVPGSGRKSNAAPLQPGKRVCRKRRTQPWPSMTDSIQALTPSTW